MTVMNKTRITVTVEFDVDLGEYVRDTSVNLPDPISVADDICDEIVSGYIMRDFARTHHRAVKLRVIDAEVSEVN